MYIKIQMRQDHISTCISKYPISKIITAMSLPLFVPERDKVPQSPPLYPRKKQMDDNSIAEYLTSKSTNIHISTKCQIHKNQVFTYHQVSISTSQKNKGYKNLPLTPITWFQLKTFKKCFITMKIDSKHENVWRSLKMNNQTLGLAFLENKNTPRPK